MYLFVYYVRELGVLIIIRVIYTYNALRIGLTMRPECV